MIASKEKIFAMAGTALYILFLFTAIINFADFTEKERISYIFLLIYDATSLIFGILFLFLRPFFRFYEKYGFIIDHMNYLLLLSIFFNIVFITPEESRLCCYLFIFPSVLPQLWFLYGDD